MKTADKPMSFGLPPQWSLRRPKLLLQSGYDFFGAPLRMVLLPDHVNERFHLTSLRAERFAAVLPELKGRILDIGAGDNALVRLYRRYSEATPASASALESVGLDVVDWGSDCVIVPDCRRLPFPDASFDTVCFVACLNHIPERKEALIEAKRVLRPGGRVVITMIGRLIGVIGHAIWWYSEDKHREIASGEEMGLNTDEVMSLIRNSGFADIQVSHFVYGLNTLYVATKK
jgi:ubiquinone/menaquinone biosynthesis C-methylase UbiE